MTWPYLIYLVIPLSPHIPLNTLPPEMPNNKGKDEDNYKNEFKYLFINRKGISD